MTNSPTVLLASPGLSASLVREQGVSQGCETELTSRSGNVFVRGSLRSAEVPGVLPLAVGRTVAGDLTTCGAAALVEGKGELRDVLPPFAAVMGGPVPRAVVDALGFRHLYATQVPAGTALATSARELARVRHGQTAGRWWDDDGVAAQGLLGWQLGARTMFAGVDKVGPSTHVEMRDDGIRYSSGDTAVPDPVDNPVKMLSSRLQALMRGYLDDHPDAVLQLTGGLDSRILLAAVPPSRRSSLTVMTLEVPGSDDTRLAKQLCEQWGMTHEVTSLAGLADLSPDAAWQRCLAAARGVDGGADPVALAAVLYAEESLPSVPRIGGLGGEVGRGFYYPMMPRRGDVTLHRAERLSRWRLFANEAAPTEMLSPDFAVWARHAVVERVYQLLRATGESWRRATDEFYLFQRMQRWAGVLASATCMERATVNPMLDPTILDIFRGAPPQAKQGTLLLSQLLMELDADLAVLPLDGRPSPQVYARPGAARTVHLVGWGSRRALAKLRQVSHRETRPPEGGRALADAVVAYWRGAASALEPALNSGYLSEAWVDQMLNGHVDPPVSAVSFLTSLVATAGGVTT